MSDDPTDEDDKNDKKGKTNLLVFPGGKKVDPNDVGAEYVISQSGNVPVAEIIDSTEIEQEVRDREKFVEKQDLVVSSRSKASTGEMIDLLIKEIVEELSHLKYERKKAAKEGKNTANYSIGRMNSLKSLADLLIKRRDSERAEQLDFKSPRFKAVFKVWLEFFMHAMDKSGILPEMIDIVVQQMQADMVDWEKKMQETG